MDLLSPRAVLSASVNPALSLYSRSLYVSDFMTVLVSTGLASLLIWPRTSAKVLSLRAWSRSHLLSLGFARHSGWFQLSLPIYNLLGWVLWRSLSPPHLTLFLFEEPLHPFPLLGWWDIHLWNVFLGIKGWWAWHVFFRSGWLSLRGYLHWSYLSGFHFAIGFCVDFYSEVRPTISGLL